MAEKLIIGKVVFGKNSLGFGLELCLARGGLAAYPATPATATACDVLLFSLFWYADIYLMEAFLRKAGIKKEATDRPVIIVGGMQATMTPEIIAEMADYVFVGDGEENLGAIIDDVANRREPSSPHIYRAGMESLPEPAVCRIQPFAIKTHGDQGGVMRVEIARGCKYKCAFCCLSGLKPYRELSHAELKPLIKEAKGKSCSFFAPERTTHSEWDLISRDIRTYGCRDLGSDARLEHVDKVDGAAVNFGLDGISTRLRKSVGKAFSTEMILEKLGGFVMSRKNIARVTAYFIGDLPGESDEDWAELFDLFLRIEAEEWSRRLVFVPVLNPLSPKPFTKLRDAPIRLFHNYPGLWENVLRKNGGQWGFRIKECLVWGPYERVIDALVQRGGAKAYQVIKKFPDKFLTGKPPCGDRAGFAREILRLAAKFGISQGQLECPAATERK